MKKRLIVLVAAIGIVFFQLSFLSKDRQNKLGNVAGIQTVSATIGEYRFILFGYGSPGALITLEGMGLYDQVYADEQGYFEFNNRFSPTSPRDACLTGRDKFGRLTNPVCLPPFPIKYNVSIGPVLLPPTISLDPPEKGAYFIGDEVLLSGQTIPNTEVELSTFTDETKTSTLSLSLIRPVEAATIPIVPIKSDSHGNFAVNLPSSNNNFFRLFTRVNYLDEASPKSNTLSFDVLPFWMIVINIIGFLFSLFKSRLLEILILAELLILLMYLIRRFFHPYLIAKNRAIILRTRYPIIKQMNYPLSISQSVTAITHISS